MGIRARLLVLAVGIAVPLALVGAADLRRVWQSNRSQLDESLKQRAELAAVAFERWIDAQRQPLLTLAAEAGEQSLRSPQLADHLRHTVQTRPYWIDARLIAEDGENLIAQPTDREPPAPALVNHLLSEVRGRNSWALATDRTRDEARPVFVLAVPVAGNGAVMARVDGAAISELFRDIEMSERAVIAVFDSGNRRLYRRQTTKEPIDLTVSGAPLVAALGRGRTAVVEMESPYDGIRRVYGLARAGNTGCVVSVGIPSSTLYEPARRQLNRHVMFSLVALACAIVAAMLIARGIMRPVLRLRRATQELGAGDFAVRAPEAGGGEIGELGAAFNRMAAQIAEREERLKELDRLKSEFVSSVSHELRTPLTTIKTLTRVLQRGRLSVEEQREYLETIAAECDRQIDLVLNLLDLSRIESGAYRIARTRVNPAEVVTACAQVEARAAEVRGLRLETDTPTEVPDVLTDREALRRVVCSLVENAIKYTPEGGRITVKAAPSREAGSVEITVRDTGCGILSEDLPFVFEKFFRGRPAPSTTSVPDAEDTVHDCRDAPGVGLGLYLAHRIVGQLDGSIYVESPPPGEYVESPPPGESRGTIFTVRLPAWQGEDGGAGERAEKEETNVEAIARG
ncbi:MAG: HAMP domain-containing protein [Acidobacteria bacterium]|nr:HAMP domain-containing protein [Acidobacteriota bacterium]